MTSIEQTLGHLAFVDGFRQMGLSVGKAVHERDGLLLCHPGTPGSRYFNSMFRTRPLTAPVDAVRAADDFFASRARGYSIVARRGDDDELVEHAFAVGATCTVERLPLMCRSTPLPTVVPPGIDVTSVTPGSEHHFVELACQIFDTTDDERAVSRVVLDDPSMLLLPHIDVLLAYENGKPVGTAMGRLSHGVGYLSWIGTVPAVRRRGIGAMLTAQLTNNLLERGATAVFLDSSAAGEPLYRALGFHELAQYCRLYRALA